MTPVAHLLRPFVDRAFRERPDLVQANVTKSCGQLTQMAVNYANADAGRIIFAFVGKHDPSESGWMPEGFVPFSTTVSRPDGQAEGISIIKVSQDAVWHLPTMQQVKAIVNSTANEDPRPEIHGPASPQGYDINPVGEDGHPQYRYTNPPVDPVTLRAVDPTGTHPVPNPTPALISQDQFAAAFGEINRFYAAPEGLQRVGGMVAGVDASVFEVMRQVAAGQITDTDTIRNAAAQMLNVTCDVQSMIAWGYQIVKGSTVAEIEKAIKGSDEWKAKHPNG